MDVAAFMRENTKDLKFHVTILSYEKFSRFFNFMKKCINQFYPNWRAKGKTWFHSPLKFCTLTEGMKLIHHQFEDQFK